MAYVQRVFKTHKPASRTLSVEEREGAQANIFTLLLQEQFAEEMKSLKAERKFQKTAKFSSYHHSWTSKYLFVPKAG